MAGKIIEFIGGLTIRQGDRVGKPFKLLGWEKRFIRVRFQPKVHTAALSISRGNGKSTLTSAIALACLLGPSVEPESDMVIVASSWG